MKLAEEFRQNAEEWRHIERLAATDVHRQRIAEVANTWLAWAERRERKLQAQSRKPRHKSGPALMRSSIPPTRSELKLDYSFRGTRMNWRSARADLAIAALLWIGVFALISAFIAEAF